MTVHIQIKKGWKKGRLCLSIGDFEGAINIYNVRKEEILDYISRAIDECLEGRKRRK